MQLFEHLFCNQVSWMKNKFIRPISLDFCIAKSWLIKNLLIDLIPFLEQINEWFSGLLTVFESLLFGIIVDEIF